MEWRPWSDGTIPRVTPSSPFVWRRFGRWPITSGERHSTADRPRCSRRPTLAGGFSGRTYGLVCRGDRWHGGMVLRWRKDPGDPVETGSAHRERAGRDGECGAGAASMRPHHRRDLAGIRRRQMASILALLISENFKTPFWNAQIMLHKGIFYERYKLADEQKMAYTYLTKSKHYFEKNDTKQNALNLMLNYSSLIGYFDTRNKDSVFYYSAKIKALLPDIYLPQKHAWYYVTTGRDMLTFSFDKQKFGRSCLKTEFSAKKHMFYICNLRNSFRIFNIFFLVVWQKKKLFFLRTRYFILQKNFGKISRKKIILMINLFRLLELLFL